jgi:hypothetical protein
MEKSIFSLRINKITTDSRMLPSFLHFLIIEIKFLFLSHYLKSRNENEVRRSDKESHLSRTLFIGLSKRLKD